MPFVKKIISGLRVTFEGQQQCVELWIERKMLVVQDGEVVCNFDPTRLASGFRCCHRRVPSGGKSRQQRDDIPDLLE